MRDCDFSAVHVIFFATYSAWMCFFFLLDIPFVLHLFKKIRLFCAAPHELIIGPILTFLGLKWPLKNGPWSCQEKIEVFKMLHGKKCSSFSDDVILRARQIEIFSGSLKSFENQPLLCRYLLICLYRLLILQHSVEDGRYQAFLLF